MHASLANSVIRRARLWTGIMVAAATGAIFVPLGLSNQPPEKVSLPVAGKAPSTSGPLPSNGAFTAALDATELAAHLNKTAPVVPVTKPKEVAAKPGEVAPEPPPPPAPPWRYIGGIMLGEDRRAIVVVSEKQQIARVGDTIDGSKLKSIDTEFLMVTDSAGVDKRVDLAPRQTRALTVLESAPPQAARPARTVALVNMNNLDGTDEATAGRLKEFYAQWQQEQVQMREPGVRARLAKLQNMLSQGDISPEDMNGHLKGLPRSPEFAELEHRYANGEIDAGTFRKLAHMAIDQQLGSTAQPGDKFQGSGGKK